MVDYHQRKGMTVAEIERWLGPNLNYEPSEEPVVAPQDLAAPVSS